MKTPALPCALLAAFVIPTQSLHAITVLQDTFDIPTDMATSGDDASDPLDTAWWRSDQQDNSRPGLSVSTDGSFFGGSSTLLVDPSIGAQPFLGAFSTVSLANIGDIVTLSVKYRQLSNLGGGFRLGLFNDGGTATSAHNDTSSLDDTGYLLNVGTPPTGNGSTNIAADLSGTGEIGNTSNLGDNAATGMLPDNLVHDITFTIERTAASTLTFTGSWTGATNGGVLTREDTAATLFSFNEVVFSWGSSSAPDYRLDDITVTFDPVPEPSAALLGALGALALLRRKR